MGLQFVERVFAVGAVTMELAESQDLAVQRRHQGGIVPGLALAADHLGETQQRLLGIGTIQERQRAIELARSRMMRRWPHAIVEMPL
jgi:hypothetical protein